MRLLTASEVSRLLQVTPARVYQLARCGSLPIVRLGLRQIRFDEVALCAWIERGGSMDEVDGK